MSTPNDEALRGAEEIDAMTSKLGLLVRWNTAHIRRLVVENEALTNGRHELQTHGKHPAPCARFCEAKAYEIEARELKRQIAEQAALIRKQGRELGEQDALLQQALEALDGVHAGEHQGGVEEAAAAIRQHREGETSTAHKTNPITN